MQIKVSIRNWGDNTKSETFYWEEAQEPSEDILLYAPEPYICSEVMDEPTQKNLGQ